MDNYEILGIQSNATEAEVKNAYHTLAKKYHPDLFESASEEEKNRATVEFQKINQAYKEIIGDLTKRTSSNVPNYYEQEQKLKQKLSDAETKKQNYEKDLRELTSDINMYQIKRNSYVGEIRISLQLLISIFEKYISHKISSNNEKLSSQIFEKKRLERQQKILEQEDLFLTPLKEMKSNLETYIENNDDQQIFGFTLSLATTQFLLSTKKYEEDLNTFLKAIESYKKEYESLNKNLEDAKTKKEQVEEKIRNLENLIATIKQSLQKMNKKTKKDGYFYQASNSFSYGSKGR